MEESNASASAINDADAAGGDGDGGVVVQIDEATAAHIAAVNEMLERPVAVLQKAASSPSPSPSPSPSSRPTLESLLASCSPLRVERDPLKGRVVVAARPLAAGETVLTEEAVAVALCRSPGTDAHFSMRDTATGSLVCTLHPWASVRTFRDSLTLAPRFFAGAGEGEAEGEGDGAEACYALLHQLTAYGKGGDHSAPASAAGGGWGDLPETPPGLDAEDPANRVPLRAQLLHAIAQANGFVVPLPEEDNDWKGSLLWPMLGRIQNPDDRERLFDDPQPLTHLTGFFPLAALLNHSCDPNITYAGGRWAEGEPFPSFSFRTTRDVAEGEEVCYPYLSGEEEEDGHEGKGEEGESEAERRRYKLLLTYRFRCRCARCLREVPGLREGEGGQGGRDPLAKHFPFGEGVDGVLAFYRMGGVYPSG
jgi:hypothetical protein